MGIGEAFSPQDLQVLDSTLGVLGVVILLAFIFPFMVASTMSKHGMKHFHENTVTSRSLWLFYSGVFGWALSSYS